MNYFIENQTTIIQIQTTTYHLQLQLTISNNLLLLPNDRRHIHKSKRPEIPRKMV